MDSAWVYLVVNLCIFLGILRLFLRRSTSPKPVSNPPNLPNFLTTRMTRGRNGYFTGQSGVTIVCLTGGPCAGKSSVIAKLMALARIHNIRVYYHPETQTIIKNGGFLSELRDMTKSQQLTYVQTLLRLQLKTEDLFFSMAKISPQKALILVEKGLLDYKVLLEPELWEGLLNENGWKEADLSDSRYHLVIHLETAAYGAEEIFDKWNEGVWTRASAIETDSKLKDVWIKHHNFRALRNMSALRNTSGLKGFEQKMEDAVKDIIAYTNPASVRSCKRKYLVECDDPAAWTGIKYAQDYIETTYLNPSASEHETEKVEARFASNGDRIYIRKTSIQPDKESKEITKNRAVLTPREYLFALRRAINEKVEKTRYSFLYQNHHYAITKYKGKREWVMRVLTFSKEDAVHIPLFVRLIVMLSEDVRLNLKTLHDEEPENTVIAVEEPQSPEINPSEEAKDTLEELKLTKVVEDPIEEDKVEFEELKLTKVKKHPKPKTPESVPEIPKEAEAKKPESVLEVPKEAEEPIIEAKESTEGIKSSPEDQSS
jgi:hypothetical protein